jgi:phosphoribosylanthranilate isomerase
VSVRVKICGVTRPDDAHMAARAGASAIGMIFWPGSPRCVSVERAAQIAAVIPPGVMKIGVFVDQPRTFVESAARAVALDGVQFHGRENAFDSIISALIIKSVAVGSGFTTASLDAIPPSVLPLLDAADARKGGTGLRVDWQLAREAARARRVVLAGGLTPANVAEAIRMVHPYAVDVSSGVESAPGRKSADRLRAFLAAVREAAGEIPGGVWV